MIGFAELFVVDTLGRICKEVDETLLLVDDGGNATVLRPHLCSTSSEILETLLSRRTSSTSKDGPEITVASDDLRSVRRRMPPRRSDDGLSTFVLSKCGDTMGPLMVKSKPFLVPPLYPPAAVTFLFGFDDLVGARWKYLWKNIISPRRQNFRKNMSSEDETLTIDHCISARPLHG